MKYLIQIYTGAAADSWERSRESEQDAVSRRVHRDPRDAGRDRRRAAAAGRDGHDRARPGRHARSRPTARSPRPRRRSAATTCSRPTISTRRSSSPRGSRPRGWAARSRCGRWWSADRAGLPRAVGPRARRAGRLPRRLRPRRGGRPGGLRDRRRALAARRHAGEPGRVARWRPRATARSTASAASGRSPHKTQLLEVPEADGATRSRTRRSATSGSS